MPDDDGGPPQFLIPPGADLEKTAWRSRRDVRRTDAEARPLPGLDAVPSPRQAAHVLVHVHGGGIAVTSYAVSGVRRTVVAVASCAASGSAGPRAVFSHETLTTTVLFDREIVRVLNEHCVMCHIENGPSFPLADLRADLAAAAGRSAPSVIAPPHAALGGGSGLRAVHQRQQPDAARDAVHRLVGRRAGTAQRRHGVHQRRRLVRRAAEGGARARGLRPLGARRAGSPAAVPAGGDRAAAAERRRPRRCSTSA